MDWPVSLLAITARSITQPEFACGAASEDRGFVSIALRGDDNSLATGDKMKITSSVSGCTESAIDGSICCVLVGYLIVSLSGDSSMLLSKAAECSAWLEYESGLGWSIIDSSTVDC